MLERIHVAVPTVFHEDESLCIEKTLSHMYRLHEQGVRSFLVCGSTGEQYSLSLEEKKALVRSLNKDNQLKTCEVFFGVSSIWQNEAKELIEYIETTSLTGILLGYSPYLLLSQEEVIYYTKSLLSSTTKKVILYNNPARTGVDLHINTYCVLLNMFPCIVGIKEAGDPIKIPELRKKWPRDVAIYAGGDFDLFKKVELGYTHLSSQVSNIYPNEIAHYFEQCLRHVHDVTSEVRYIHDVYKNTPIVYIKRMCNLGACRAPLGHGEEVYMHSKEIE